MLCAVDASDADGACGAYAHAATWADILARAGRSWRLAGDFDAAVWCAGLSDEEARTVISVYQNVGQSVLDYKVEKLFRWSGARPSVFVAMADGQGSLFCRFLEAFVVVCIAATAILNAVFVVVIVNHIMEQGSANFFDRSRESSCTDVDFVRVADGGNPCIIIECKVTVRARRALNCDGRS